MTSVGGTLSASGTPRSTGSRMGRPSKSCQACKDDHAKCDGTRACCEKNPTANPEGSNCPNHDPVARKEVEEQMERLRRVEEEMKNKEQGQGGTPTGGGDKKAGMEVAAAPAPQATNIPITTVPVPLLKRPLPPVDINVMTKRPSRPATFLPATPDTRGVPPSPRPTGPPASLPFSAQPRMPQMMERELDSLRAKVRSLEDEKNLLEQKLQLTRKGSAGLCCRIKPYDLQVPQGKMVVRRRVAQRIMDLWKEHGYYDIEIKSIEVVPAGMPTPLHLELKDPNEEERRVYWQQQLDKRAAGEIEITGMEIEDEEDVYARRRGLLHENMMVDATAFPSENLGVEERGKTAEGEVAEGSDDGAKLPPVPMAVAAVGELTAGEPAMLVDLALPAAPLPTAETAPAPPEEDLSQHMSEVAPVPEATVQDEVEHADDDAIGRGLKRTSQSIEEEDGEKEASDDESGAKRAKTRATAEESEEDDSRLVSRQEANANEEDAEAPKPDATEDQQAAKIIAGMGSRTVRKR